MTKSKTHYLTNRELIAQLSMRNDLSCLEEDMLDRMIRMDDEMARLENELTGAPQPVPAHAQSTQAA